MADHSILGSSGVEVDFGTGRPREPVKAEAHASKARQRLNNAVVDAWTLGEELHQNSQVLRVWLEQYRARLLELAQNDPVCKALEAPIRTLRQTLEFKPRLAEKVALRALGPQLASIIADDT
jgi:hypothetical protein